jgi:hypothetical protein
MGLVVKPRDFTRDPHVQFARNNPFSVLILVGQPSHLRVFQDHLGALLGVMRRVKRRTTHSGFTYWRPAGFFEHVALQAALKSKTKSENQLLNQFFRF